MDDGPCAGGVMDLSCTARKRASLSRSRRSAGTWPVTVQARNRPATAPVPHGRREEGEVRLLRVAAAVYQEFDVVHLHGLAPVGLLDDRQEVGADLVPDLEEVAAQGIRVLAGKDLPMAIVVDSCSMSLYIRDHARPFE